MKIVRDYLVKPNRGYFETSGCVFYDEEKSYIALTDNEQWIVKLTNNKKYDLLIKTGVKGNMYYNEKPLDFASAENLLKKKLGNTIVKRVIYLEKVLDKRVKFKVFGGELSDLRIMEITFDSEEEYNAFQMPQYLLCDITEDDYFDNTNLIYKTKEEVEEYIEKLELCSNTNVTK